MILDRELMVSALPGYELGEELGRGASGIVVAARHRNLDRFVAIKQLPRALAVDEEAQTRFVAEARLIARLDHPHVVKVFDYIADQGMRLIVMEYLPGGSLWDRFTTAGLDSHQACALALCMCAGLQSAHQQGILHRDMKPENVLLAEDGTPRLSDFGIAKVSHGPTNLTLAGTIIGTPTYMAPEQAVGAEIGPECDIYALGTMLFELLAGRAPFDDLDNPAALLYAHVHTPPPDLAQIAPTVPAGIVDVVMRTLEKDPKDRYSSAQDFGVSLARASAQSFGQGWLRQSGIPLREGGPIADAALEGASGPRSTMVKVSQIREHGLLEVDSGLGTSEHHQLGIDFGTANTAVAVHRGGSAYVLHLGNRSATTPSAVFIDDDGSMRVGDAAARRLIVDPDRVVIDFKRQIGDPAPMVVGSTSLTPVELTTAVLGWVIERARGGEDVDPDHVTVSHPANWPDFKKDILAQAISRVTGATTSLITEPQAAAVYYASQERVEPGAVVVIYDLGGGTFDSAVLRKTDTGFEILGEPEGIERLGGIDFDEALFHHVARKLDGAPLQLDSNDSMNATALAFLRRECIDAKEALSTDTETRVSVMLPNAHRDIIVTRDEFEGLIRPRLMESLSALRRSMASAGVGSSDVDAVLLIGGSSRIPLVREMVSESVAVPIAVDVHPKHCVALGAALVKHDAVIETAELHASAMGSADQAPTISPTNPLSPRPTRAAVAPTILPQPHPPGNTANAKTSASPAVAPTRPPSAPDSGAPKKARWWIPAVGALLIGAVVIVLLMRSSSTTPVLSVALTGGTVEDGRFNIRYVTENFEPVVDDTDPDAYHIHFFWNIYDAERVGTQVPADDRDPFVTWDRNAAGELVFDAFKVADRPARATAICAVVADNADAVHLPDLASFTGSCITLQPDPPS